MRLPFWFGLLLTCAAASAACSIDRRSDAFACDSTADCSPDRVCVEQTCVLGSRVPDAGADGPACPPGCSRCDGKSCFIDCTLQRCNDLVCPVGFTCEVMCGAGGCDGIDCRGGPCNLFCLGVNACRDVTCGDKACRVSCVGRKSCVNIDCEDSCSCDVTCTATESCAGNTCPTDCAGLNGGCDGTSPTCNRCQ
jgi:hypothetical protein